MWPLIYFWCLPVMLCKGPCNRACVVGLLEEASCVGGWIIIEHGDVCCVPRPSLRVFAEFARDREGSSLDSEPSNHLSSSSRLRKVVNTSIWVLHRWWPRPWHSGGLTIGMDSALLPSACPPKESLEICWIDYLINDKMSTVGRKTLGQVDRHLCQAFPRHS